MGSDCTLSSANEEEVSAEDPPPHNSTTPKRSCGSCDLHLHHIMKQSWMILQPRRHEKPDLHGGNHWVAPHSRHRRSSPIFGTESAMIRHTDHQPAGVCVCVEFRSALNKVVSPKDTFESCGQWNVQVTTCSSCWFVPWMIF